MEAGGKDRPPMLVPDKKVPISEGISVTTTERYKETYKNVSQDLRDQLNAEAKAHQDEVNEIRAERIASTANPLALVAQQQPVYHPQNHPSHYTQNSSTRSQQAATRNRGKSIVNSPSPIYDQESSMVAEDDEIGAGYDNQRLGNVAGARENVEVTPDTAENSGAIFDTEPLEKNDADNDLANEHELLASLIEKLKCKIDDSKNHNKFLETSNKVLVDKLKETNKLLYDDFKKSQAELDKRNRVEYVSKKEDQIKLYKTHEDNELDKVIALENKVKVLDNIVYKTGQSVQTINMLNSKCQTSFAKPEFLKKDQRANPRLYDI
nr:hypothetical protein [Tanacetum cinerariifolium]